MFSQNLHDCVLWGMGACSQVQKWWGGGHPTNNQTTPSRICQRPTVSEFISVFVYWRSLFCRSFMTKWPDKKKGTQVVKQINPIDMYQKSVESRKYDKVVFDPSTTDHTPRQRSHQRQLMEIIRFVFDRYNIFQGLRIPPDQFNMDEIGEREPEGAVPFFEHLFFVVWWWDSSSFLFFWFVSCFFFFFLFLCFGFVVFQSKVCVY